MTEVYIGGGDQEPGAFDYLKDPAGWPFVREHANGYYINRFVFPPATDKNGHIEDLLRKMASLFTNKNVFYETDFHQRHEGGRDDKVNIDRLIYSNSFEVVKYATTAIRWEGDLSEEQATHIKELSDWRAWRPLLALRGPWDINGDMDSDAGKSVQAAINHMSGSATDGPMLYWKSDYNQTQLSSYLMVKYAHSKNKLAMVMICPFGSGSGTEFLRLGKECVRNHEANGASPDIWAISYYCPTEAYPVTPEQVNGQPAETITGLAYWLIHHLRDPQRWP